MSNKGMAMHFLQLSLLCLLLAQGAESLWNVIGWTACWLFCLVNVGAYACKVAKEAKDE